MAERKVTFSSTVNTLAELFTLQNSGRLLSELVKTRGIRTEGNLKIFMKGPFKILLQQEVY